MNKHKKEEVVEIKEGPEENQEEGEGEMDHDEKLSEMIQNPKVFDYTSKYGVSSMISLYFAEKDKTRKYLAELTVAKLEIDRLKTKVGEWKKKADPWKCL